MNGFLVLDGGAVVPPLNELGMSGGGRLTPVENPVLFDELNCSRVGGFTVLVNGFIARGAVEPNGLVAGEKKINRY